MASIDGTKKAWKKPEINDVDSSSEDIASGVGVRDELTTFTS